MTDQLRRLAKGIHDRQPSLIGTVAADAGARALRGSSAVLRGLTQSAPGILGEEIGQQLQGLSRKSAVLAALDPLGRFVEKQGAQLRESAQLAQKLHDQFVEEATGGVELEGAAGTVGEVSEALGSTVPLLALGALSAPAGAAVATITTAGSGALVNGAGEFERVMAKPDATEEEAWKAMAIGGGAGLLEAVPISRALARINERSGGALKRFLVDPAIEAGEEGVQEAIQAMASNVIDRYVLDEDVELLAGAMDSGETGAMSGFILQALLGTAAGQRRLERMRSDAAGSGETQTEQVEQAEPQEGAAPQPGELTQGAAEAAESLPEAAAPIQEPIQEGEAGPQEGLITTTQPEAQPPTGAPDRSAAEEGTAAQAPATPIVPQAQPDRRGKRAQAASGDLGLREYARSLGGLQATGETERFSNLEQDTKGRRPITRREGDGGVSLDELGERAWELGFFAERPSEAELLDALERDIPLLGTAPGLQAAQDAQDAAQAAQAEGQADRDVPAPGAPLRLPDDPDVGEVRLAVEETDGGFEARIEYPGLGESTLLGSASDLETAQKRARLAMANPDDPTMALIPEDAELDAALASGGIDYLFAGGVDLAGDAKELLERAKRKLGLQRRVPVTEDGLAPSATTTERFIRWAQNSLRPLKSTQEKLETQVGQLEDQLDVYLQEELRRGRAKSRMEEVESRFVKPMGRTLRRAGISLEEAGEFLMARHAAERNETIRRRTGEGSSVELNEAGSGMTDQEAAEILQNAQNAPEAKRAGFDRLAGLFDAMNAQVRRGWVEDGLETQEYVNQLETQWSAYAPLRSDLDEETNPTKGQGQGVSTRGQAARGATGRYTRADAEKVIGYAIAQAEQSIQRGEKNRVANAMADLAESYSETLDGAFVIDKESTRPVLENGMVRNRPDPRYATQDHVLSFRRDGENHTITAAKGFEPVIQALKNHGAQNAGRVTEHVAKATRLLAGMSTRWNPFFPPFNAVRDVAGSFLNSGEYGWRFAREVTSPKSLAQAAGAFSRLKRDKAGDTGWDRYAREYQQDGGPIAFLDLRDVNEQVERLRSTMDLEARSDRKGSLLRQGKAVLDAVDHVNETVENMTRLSFYRHARESLGWSRQRAAAGAKNLTTNFERGGDVKSFLSGWYMFANAGIQGTARVGQALKSPNVRKAMVGAVAFSVAWDSLMRAYGGEDEDGQAHWDKIPPHEKRTNFIVMFPDGSGRRVTIPLPFVFNWFQTLGQEIGAVTFGPKNRGQGLAEIGAAAMDAFNPLGGSFEPSPEGAAQFVAPTLLEPLIQLATNRDFAMRPIQPGDYGTGTPDSQLFFDSATESSKAVTSFLNEVSGGDEFEAGAVDISPETLDHLTAFLTGGLGNEVTRMHSAVEKARDPQDSPSLRDIPILRRLVRGPSPYQSHRDFRDLRTSLKAEKKRRDAQGARVPLAVANLLNDARALERTRRAQLERADRLRGDKRREVLERLDAQVQRWNGRARRALLGQ